MKINHDTINKIETFINKLENQLAIVQRYDDLISNNTKLKIHMNAAIIYATEYDNLEYDEDRFKNIINDYKHSLVELKSFKNKILADKKHLHEIYNQNFLNFLNKNFDITVNHRLLINIYDEELLDEISNSNFLTSLSSNPDLYKSIVTNMYGHGGGYVQGMGAGGGPPNPQSEDDSLLYRFVQFGFSLMWIVNDFETFISELTLIHSFSKIKNNAVIIGSNGSGKSTLANSLIANGRIDNIEIVRSHHMLFIPNKPFNFDQSSDLNLDQSYNTRKDLYFDEDNFINDFHNIFDYLIKEHTMLKGDTHVHDATQSKLEIIVETVNNLLDKRLIAISGGSIKGYFEDELIYYDFNSLSDGERKIIYLLSRVLIADPNSYIIIDEPENHINPNILYTLCDKLESFQPSSTFIYITHDPNFASSRTGSTLVWSKEFIAPDKWEFEIIDNNNRNGIPEELLIQILGSKKKILFCEGENSSLDKIIYSSVFPEYQVIAVGGHRQVIDYTRAMLKLSFIHHNEVKGIIDFDNLNEKAIETYMKDNIYVLPFNEIEMLMISYEVIDHLSEDLLSFSNIDDFNIENFYFEMIEKIKLKSEQIISYLVVGEIDSYFESSKIGDTKSKSRTFEQFNQMLSNIKIENIWEEHEKQLEEYINAGEINKILRICNLKNDISANFVNKYFNIPNYRVYFQKRIKKDTVLVEILKTLICEKSKNSSSEVES